MKTKVLTSFLLSILLVFSLAFSSCDGEDNSRVKNLEGHWIYVETKADVYLIDSDQAVSKAVREYVQNRNSAYKVSYEFKNDKTYYYYQNFAEPLKGIYKIIDKNYLTIDDSRGEKSLMIEDSTIYIVSDMKEEIARELDLDISKIVKVTATDIFERGLFTH